MKSIPYSPYEPGFNYGFDVEREDWIPIRPRRYVYHLDYGRGRRRRNDMEFYKYKRLNITLNGLYGKDQGNPGVWANNQMENIFNLYPVNIDGFGMSLKEILEWVLSFDVWRIDTHAFEAQWYVDPNHMLTDYYQKEKWVFTESSVPPHALKLFHFNINEFTFLFKEANEVEFWLEPHKETNRIIEYKRVQRKLASYSSSIGG